MKLGKVLLKTVNTGIKLKYKFNCLFRENQLCFLLFSKIPSKKIKFVDLEDNVHIIKIVRVHVDESETKNATKRAIWFFHHYEHDIRGFSKYMKKKTTAQNIVTIETQNLTFQIDLNNGTLDGETPFFNKLLLIPQEID